MPSGLKKIRRGPSELNDSTALALPPTKGTGGEATGVAATQKALGAPEAL